MSGNLSEPAAKGLPAWGQERPNAASQFVHCQELKTQCVGVIAGIWTSAPKVVDCWGVKTFTGRQQEIRRVMLTTQFRLDSADDPMPIEEKEVDGIEGLLREALTLGKTQADGGFLWYRGLNQASHKLLPKIMREGKPIEQVFERERRLLTRFRQRSLAYWPAGYPQTDWEHLFAMQHYGMPTRLGKYPPAKPGALGLEPPVAVEGVADAAPELDTV